jgi:hypothetical protein
MSDVANAVVPSNARRSQPATSSLVSVVSQSSTQGANGQILFNLGNTPNTFIRNGSVYLKFKLTAKTTVKASADQWIRPGTAQCTAALDGAGAQAESSYHAGSWAAVIQRLTIQAGASVVEQINNYNVYHEALALHTSGNYGLQDQQLLEAGQYAPTSPFAYSADVWKVAKDVDVNAERSAYICIPLFAGVFNAQDNKDFPLGLLQGGVQIVIDLASDIYALKATNCAPSMSISEAVLSYEAVTVSSEYMNALRGQLAQSGQLFQMPFVSCLSMNVASSNTLDVVYGVGLASLKAVLFTNKAAATRTNFNDSKMNAGNNLRIYADGKLQNNFQIAETTTFYVELNRALGTLASRTSTSGHPDMYKKYGSTMFYGGIGFNKFNESGLTMTGTACAQLQFHLDQTITAGDVTYIMMMYDALLAISPVSGESSVIR